MLNFELDFRSRIPIYTQVVDHIQQMLLRGDLKPGDQLPTVRSLALELRVNFNTIARAYRLLDEAGIISTQQGRGTYILSMPPPDLAEELRRSSLHSLVHQLLVDASRLGVQPAELAESLTQQLQQWEKTGTPVTLETKPEPRGE